MYAVIANSTKRGSVMKQKSVGNPSIFRLLFRVIQGALIGLGAVLPGISGGVLCVVFGIYKPIMELLSHPIKNFKTHVPKLLPVIIRESQPRFEQDEWAKQVAGKVQQYSADLETKCRVKEDPLEIIIY